MTKKNHFDGNNLYFSYKDKWEIIDAFILNEGDELIFPMDGHTPITSPYNEIKIEPPYEKKESWNTNQTLSPNTTEKDDFTNSNIFIDWVEHPENQSTPRQCPPFLKSFLLFNFSVFAFLNLAGGIAALIEGTTDIKALDFVLQATYEFFGESEFTRWLNLGFEEDMNELQEYALRVGQAQTTLNTIWLFGKAISSGTKKIKNCLFSSAKEEEDDYSSLNQVQGSP